MLPIQWLSRKLVHKVGWEWAGREVERKPALIQCGSIEGKGRKSCEKLEVADSVKEHTELGNKIEFEQCPLYKNRVVIVEHIRAGSEEWLGERGVWKLE